MTPKFDLLGRRNRFKWGNVTLLALMALAMIGLITFYGPALVASFGEFAPLVDQTYNYFSSLVMAEQSTRYTYSLPESWTEEMIPWEDQDRPKNLRPNRCEFRGEGSVSGRLIGGNLNTMWSIWGSPYMPDIRFGDILLIEDSLKHISVVERLFTFLKLNGVFDRVAAIVLGKHELFDDGGSKRTPMDVLQEVLNGQKIPIVNGFDCCHTHPMVTMPLGVKVAVDFDQERVEVIEPWLG